MCRREVGSDMVTYRTVREQLKIHFKKMHFGKINFGGTQFEKIFEHLRLHIHFRAFINDDS